MRRLLLDGMLRLHIQFLCHLIAIIRKQIVIQRLMIAGYRTSDGSSVGCKNSSNFGDSFLYIKCSHSGHPFMCLIYHLIRFCQVVAVETFYYSSGSVRKHRSLVVIAISVQRVYLKTIPHFCVYIVLLFKKRLEINKNDNGFTGDIPSSYTDGKMIVFKCMLFPGSAQIIRLDE